GTSGGSDAFLCALNASNGAAVTSFGTNGWVKFGGTGTESGTGLTIVGGTIYLCGEYASTDAGIGGTGSIAPAGLRDAFVAAFDITTGSVRGAFGNNGVVTFGGGGNESCSGIASNSSRLYITGGFDSIDAGVNGAGNFDATNFGSYLLRM